PSVAPDGSGRPGGTRLTSSRAGQALDARTILLTSADTVAKTPATTGADWYTRERETRLISPDQAVAKRLAKKFGKGKKPAAASPITASVSSTEEAWTGRNGHDRTVTGIDPKIAFPSEAEKAKWTKLTPAERQRWDLDVSGKPKVSNYDFSSLKLSLNQQDKTVAALEKLPSDPAALEKTLRTWFAHENQVSKAHDGVPMGGDFSQYVFGQAQDLLAGPLTPGTKATLYRLLAKQPGITYLGTKSDSLGREGAVLTMSDPGSEAEEIRLIIDPKTGQLLAQESGPRAKPLLTMTYESVGWVNSLGARP
ncbi:hypothetical protein ACFFNX_37645, partial [Actinoallomurus acaciae]